MREARSSGLNPESYLPTPEILDVLRGEISEPLKTISQKPDPTQGVEVEVRIVKEGVGLWGLEDWKDSREWSGIQNHMWLTARYAVHMADKMKQAGYDINPQTMLDAMLVSHVGRRQWDEAGWYPDIVEDAGAKRGISNETLGLQLLQGKVSDEIFEVVAALAHNLEGFDVDPEVFDSWEYKLSIYTDHRTSQKYEPLNTRMGDFLLSNFFAGEQVTEDLKQKVYADTLQIIERRKQGAISLEEADEVMAAAGASEESSRVSRKDLVKLILNDADTEARLQEIGIDPDSINDETVPMPEWEEKLRRDYVEAAGESIVSAIERFVNNVRWYTATDGWADSFIFEREVPKNTWWGQYARELYIEKTGDDISSFF